MGTNLTQEMRVARVLAGKSMEDCRKALGYNSAEVYRLREIGKVPITGSELAMLANLYEKPLAECFPSYRPTHGERLLTQELAGAA